MEIFVYTSRRGVNIEEEEELLKLRYYTDTVANRHIQVLTAFNLEIIILVFPIGIAREEILASLR